MKNNVKKQVKIYLTEAQHQKMKIDAIKFKKNLGDFIYHLYSNKPLKIEVEERKENLKINRELSGIANNLNQIARHLNQGNEIDNNLRNSIKNLINDIIDFLNVLNSSK